MSFCQSCGAAFAVGTTRCPTCTDQPKPGAGLESNAAAALAYLAGIITGILFLVIEPSKSDRFVRFHALQAIFFNLAWIALWAAWMVVRLLLGAVSNDVVPILQAPVDVLLLVGGFALWTLLMFTAYQGKTTYLPIVGALAATTACVKQRKTRHAKETKPAGI